MNLIAIGKGRIELVRHLDCSPLKQPKKMGENEVAAASYIFLISFEESELTPKMAQLERRKKLSESPKSPKSQTSPSSDQLLRGTFFSHYYYIKLKGYLFVVLVQDMFI